MCAESGRSAACLSLRSAPAMPQAPATTEPNTQSPRDQSRSYCQAARGPDVYFPTLPPTWDYSAMREHRTPCA
eukprot:scaffold14519_cov135-Isochrysis_galbana.AAC.6